MRYILLVSIFDAIFVDMYSFDISNPLLYSPACYSHLDASECHAVNGSVYFEAHCYNSTQAAQMNISSVTTNQTQLSSPAQDYFM